MVAERRARRVRRAGTEERDMAGNNFSGFSILGGESSVTVSERKRKKTKEIHARERRDCREF